MTNSILAGKVIYQRLRGISGLDGRIYPVVAEQSTVYPFAIYYKTGLSGNVQTKDYYSEDSLNFTVAVVSDKYYQSCEIANDARRELEKRRIEGQDMVLYDVRLLGIDESYEDNAYV